MYSWVTVHMWMSELGFSSPCPQCTFQDSNLCHWAWPQAPLPMELSHWPSICLSWGDYVRIFLVIFRNDLTVQFC